MLPARLVVSIAAVLLSRFDQAVRVGIKAKAKVVSSLESKNVLVFDAAKNIEPVMVDLE